VVAIHASPVCVDPRFGASVMFVIVQPPVGAVRRTAGAAVRFCAGLCGGSSMIPKSGYRFSEKIMLL